MRRADRLFLILQYLRGGRLTTADTLAARLEVSRRTIYRDVADLMASGVPIDGAAGAGYLLCDGFDLPPLMFTRAEITALVAGARLIRAWGGADMALAADEALVKIAAVLPAADRARANAVPIHAMARPAMTDALRALIDRIERAVDDRTRLRITYRDAAGADTCRILRPLGLWFWGEVWTLVAWCEMRGDFRMFRLDRIADCTPDGAFRPVPGQSLRDFWASEAYRH